MNESTMRSALKALDLELQLAAHKKISLIMGGGAALILAHQIPLSTHDIDAIPQKMTMDEIDPYIKKVAHQLELSPDWMNPYFSTFSHTLPSDYEKRLITVYDGPTLLVLALSKEEMLIMKCFAHRQKDIGHARALIKRGADVDFVLDHFDILKAKRIPNTETAIKFLEDLLE